MKTIVALCIVSLLTGFSSVLVDRWLGIDIEPFWRDMVHCFPHYLTGFLMAVVVIKVMK